MTATPFYYPDRMGKIILQAMEEILGRNGLHAILNLASLSDLSTCILHREYDQALSFATISHLHSTLERFYGPHGGRGVALRIGRACFQHGLREFGPLHGLTDLTFRLLPMQTRFETGAAALADIFNKHSDQRVRLENKDTFLLWHIERCPLCWERTTDSPCCQMAVGLLQESLYWMSGGKYYRVEEIACLACGDAACTILIEKKPMS
ncbi:MAG: 4-vinyl reductase [Anaerolineae bacterium]|nr:MAG: 4-vinyl reductase [Anaerolineae bacterium]